MESWQDGLRDKREFRTPLRGSESVQPLSQVSHDVGLQYSHDTRQLTLSSRFVDTIQYLMSRPRTTHADVIDVDALPERNRSRRPGRRTVVHHMGSRGFRRTTATIDLTNVDSDSDSNITILSSMPKPDAGSGTPGVSSKGKGREMDIPSTIGPAIDKVRVCSF